MGHVTIIQYSTVALLIYYYDTGTVRLLIIENLQTNSLF